MATPDLPEPRTGADVHNTVPAERPTYDYPDPHAEWVQKFSHRLLGVCLVICILTVLWEVL